MKRILTLFCCLCAALASCRQVPVDEPFSQGDHSLSEDQVFWGVVGQLVGLDQMTPDYKGKSFSPTIGEEVESGVRVVSVNSLAAAVAKFNMLTDAGITEDTATYPWYNAAVGSLTWNKGDETTAWATVDVSIPSVTGLTKIIYRSADQGDTNGGVKNGGSAYYRFGDVISRVRPASEKGGNIFPEITEYWVCVRPAFDPEDKGDSHWISLSPLPRENVWPYYTDKYNYGPYVGSNGNNYGVPYNLGKETEWIQDFAEMLYAIVMSGKNGNWSWYVDNYSGENWRGAPTGLPIFGDFHKSKAYLHNDFFWQNVQTGWEQYDIYTKIFGIEDGRDAGDGLVKHDRSWLAQRVADGGDGLKFLYKGYSWWVTTSNNLDLYQAWYKSVSDNKHLQHTMHAAEYKTLTKQVTNPRNTSDAATNIPVNVKTDVSVEKPFLINEKFFGDKEPRFICRYATGEELAKMVGGKWDPQFRINGFEDVYRYYGHIYPDKDLLEGPETTESIRPQETDIVVNDPAKQDVSTNYDGRSYFRFADVYKDEKGHHWFVAHMSGDYNNKLGESPYTELISFDGIQTSVDRVRGLNLPTRNQAIRGAVFLWHLFERGALSDSDVNINNIEEGTGVDIRTLIQKLRDGENIDYNGSAQVSVAYDGLVGMQSLLRLICDPTLSNDNLRPALMFWEHYPSAPYLESKLGTGFSANSICLEDVADQSKVDAYANDMYAKMQAWKGGTSYTPDRAIRSQANPDAALFENYLYEKLSWNSYNYPTDMWNAPVLSFRMTRIYDRGPTSHATITVDGHTLTLEKARPWNDGNNLKAYNAEREAQARLYEIVTRYLYLDGAVCYFPSWKQWND